MPDPTGIGVYAAELTAGTEVSSTYEGRHITVLESELIHPFRASTFVNKGDPVIICNATVVAERGNAIGVALSTATALTDYIAVDTEGIFNLPVWSYDDTGAGNAIVAGDPLYIHDGSDAGATVPAALGIGDAVISKRRNLVTQIPFGYALGALAATGTGVMAVKVHWDPRQPQDELAAFAGTPATANGFTFTINDSSVPTGWQPGVIIEQNTSGLGIGAITSCALYVGVTATGNSGGWHYAINASVDPSGLGGNQAEMAGARLAVGSFAGKTITNCFAVELGLYNDGTSTMNDFIYMRGHGAVPVDGCMWIHADSVTNFLQFQGYGVPIVAGTPAGTGKHYLNVTIGGVAHGIICDTVA